MEIKLDTLEVINNLAEKRFELWIDGQLSKLDYTIDDDTIMMTHVGVPNEFRGQGLAGVITKVALEYAKAKSLRVIPVCPYVLAYIRRNKQYLELTRSK